jgi:hypothetical protein
MIIENNPICLFTYNRLNETKKTIGALKNNYLAITSELFIFSDGWKNEEDKVNVLELRSYLKTIDGFKNVTIYESLVNKGLANSIIHGVSEILNKFNKVIVMEDDLITTPNFLNYMNQALEVYEKRDDIISISGHSLKFNLPKNYDSNVYLYGRAGSWGWGTWRSKWANVDWEIKDYEIFKNDYKAQREFNRNGSDMSNMLKGYFEGKNNSWAIRFCYNQFRSNMYSVFPVTSKVDNVGFGDDATNCKGYNRFKIELDRSNIIKFNMPLAILANKKISKQITYYLSFTSRLKSKILTIYYNYLK